MSIIILLFNVKLYFRTMNNNTISLASENALENLPQLTTLQVVLYVVL
jgi:hypothetical protein